MFSVYILFEICWLVTGAVWVAGVEREECGNTVYMFSLVVIINFGVHLLTPLLFMVILCCSKIGFCQGLSSLWGGATSAGEHWTRAVRSTLILTLNHNIDGNGHGKTRGLIFVSNCRCC